MARATHLTIGTSDRIRLDASRNDYDNDYDEEEGNEVRQEVQVSITYVLDPGDTDLTLLAAEKAEEVQRAHTAAWDRIGVLGTSALGNANSGCTCRRDRGEQNDESEDENDDPEDGLPGSRVPADPPPTDPPARAWYLPGASRFRNGSPEKGPRPDRETRPKSDKEPVTDEEPVPDEQPVTGPQKILIRSRAKKAGLTAYALERLLHEQFHVWRIERLSKSQAASLLDALERDLKERDLKEKNLEEKGNGSSPPSFAGGSYAA